MFDINNNNIRKKRAAIILVSRVVSEFDIEQYELKFHGSKIYFIYCDKYGNNEQDKEILEFILYEMRKTECHALTPTDIAPTIHVEHRIDGDERY